jgi:hypothetical protein
MCGLCPFFIVNNVENNKNVHENCFSFEEGNVVSVMFRYSYYLLAQNDEQLRAILADDSKCDIPPSQT